VVGDITVDKAVEAVSRTFAALPARAAEQALSDDAKRVGFPAGTAQPVALTHKGRGDQAIGFVAWPTTDLWANPQQALETDVMAEVMGLRLIDKLRIEQGASYSPSVNYTHSDAWTGWGYLGASVEVPPDKLSGFFADVDKIAADLRAKPVTADELERAKKPRLEGIAKSRVTNSYWLAELSGAQAQPRKLDFIRHILPGTEKVTAADVQHAAQLVLDQGKTYRLEVEPQGVKVAKAD
jgi:zinc protease